MNPQEFLDRMISERLVAGIPVGMDPIFPMSQEEFSDYVKQRIDQRRGPMNNVLEKYGGSVLEYLKQNPVRGI